MASSRFGYYARLSAKDKAVYRRSDGIGGIPLPDAAALAPLVANVEAALLGGKRVRVAAAANALTAAVLTQLGAPPLKVHVRAVRPQIRGGELHGLYTYAQEGKAPRIEVWMRTAARAEVVRFRTFLRTLFHEIIHHLDLTILELEDSFHTEGFFRRESSLVRQLVPRLPPKPKAKSGDEDKRQLALF